MNMRRHGFADSLQPGDSPVDRRVSSCAGVAERVPRGALVLSSIACCLAFQSIAHGGSGFELRSQSATTLGSAQAGMTAAAEDISYIAFNPAALGKGEGMQFAIGATGLLTSVRMSHPMASTVLSTPIAGDDGGNGGTATAVPNLYFGADIAKGVRLGFGLAPRFGLGSYWSDNWAGRYHAAKSELTTEDFTPTISFKPNDALTAGFALDIQYARIKTSNAIDFGTLDQIVTSGLFGGIPGGSDGRVHVRGDAWAVGYAAGLLYELPTGTRLGLAYRSGIRQRLKGTATFETGGVSGQAIAAATGAFTTTDARADLKLPAMASIGLKQSLSSDWEATFDVKWTGWHALQNLELQFANSAQPSVITVLDWRDSWFVAVGARYRLNDKMAVRFGAAWDQSPTRDQTRTPSIPDSDSRWLALGLQYRFAKATTLDLAYGHVMASDTTVNLSAAGPGNTFRGNLAAGVRSSRVDYLALQLGHQF